jgi:hypothetical protein
VLLDRRIAGQKGRGLGLTIGGEWEMRKLDRSIVLHGTKFHLCLWSDDIFRTAVGQGGQRYIYINNQGVSASSGLSSTIAPSVVISSEQRGYKDERLHRNNFEGITGGCKSIKSYHFVTPSGAAFPEFAQMRRVSVVPLVSPHLLIFILRYPLPMVLIKQRSIRKKCKSISLNAEDKVYSQDHHERLGYNK